MSIGVKIEDTVPTFLAIILFVLRVGHVLFVVVMSVVTTDHPLEPSNIVSTLLEQVSTPHCLMVIVCTCSRWWLVVFSFDYSLSAPEYAAEVEVLYVDGAKSSGLEVERVVRARRECARLLSSVFILVEVITGLTRCPILIPSNTASLIIRLSSTVVSSSRCCIDE